MSASKSKSHAVYVCQQCGAQSAGWAGRCAECSAWNSVVETLEIERPATLGSTGPRAQPVALNGILSGSFARLNVPIGEFSRVLGGGIVPGSVILLGGDPGIGKSTLLLQVAAALASTQRPVFYASGEESAEQIKLRADRLGLSGDGLLLLAETQLDHILAHLALVKPAVVIVDSIQTVALDGTPGAAGSVTQVRECAMALVRYAKSSGIPVFLVGHVTKEGTIAGPRVLEHIVDTVLYLEGERYHSYRLLRGIKNRFGSTNEVGVFEMQGDGMVEVTNPSAAFLAERPAVADGSAVVVTLEGTRPMLVEVQALAATTSFGLPRRTATGIELGRLLILVAVLTKRVGLGLSNQDIYVNVVGGMKIGEPAADLSVALAISSSYREKPVPADLVAIGEVGLSGELRRVSHLERRLAEAAKLGFSRCLVPRSGVSERLAHSCGLQLIPADSVNQALASVWPTR